MTTLNPGYNLNDYRWCCISNESLMSTLSAHCHFTLPGEVIDKYTLEFKPKENQRKFSSYFK